MKTKILIMAALFTAILLVPSLYGGELTFGWNLVNPTGAIYDMEFMPDNNYFILGEIGSVQVRNTETGKLVQSYPFGASQIEFTPDSNRLLVIPTGDTVGKLQLRNLIDMSLIKEYVIPADADIEGLEIYQSWISFDEMVVDPVRPLVYAMRHRGGYLSGGKYFSIYKIMIYNYETMEEVGKLTTTDEEGLVLEKMAISKDGKYLAVNSQGASSLRIWSLETGKIIRNLTLCPPEIVNIDVYGTPSCTKFSELNTDLIYFSGRFPKSVTDDRFYGLLAYSILENKIIDSTFAVGSSIIGDGYFTIFDNEERVILANYGFITVVNIKEKNSELILNIDSINYLKRWDSKTIYSQDKNKFIGNSLGNYSTGIYDSETGISENPISNFILYPNPTSGIITLTELCENANLSFEIFDVNGLLLTPAKQIIIGNNSFSINLSDYPDGVYFLKIYCGSDILTYKIIKEI